MPVPQSVEIRGEPGSKAPALFTRKKPFDNSANILNILKSGGLVRGIFSDGAAGPFEILTKKERSEGLHESAPGAGRWVPSHIVDWMIRRQQIFVVPGEKGAPFVYCELTQDDVYSDGFPAGWGVRHVPSTNATHLFAPNDGAELIICERAQPLSVEDWVPLARAMAFGLYAQETLLDRSLQRMMSAE